MADERSHARCEGEPAKQLGHSVAIAERHYLDVVRGIPATAKTLEAAMGIEEVVGMVVGAYPMTNLTRRQVSGMVTS